MTVVLNSYNQRPYLGEAVTSVLTQSYGSFELLIVDNGSSDGSQDLLKSVADDRVRLFLHEENRPVTQRFNEAVSEATGDFVSFLYSDDLYLPDKLAMQVARFEALDDTFGVVYGIAIQRDERSGEERVLPTIGKSGWVLQEILECFSTHAIDMCSPMFRSQCLRQHRFNEAIFGEGEAIVLRIAMTHQLSFVDAPLVVLRDRGTNAGKAIRKNASMVDEIFACLYRHDTVGPGLLRLLRRAYAGRAVRYAWEGARLGEDRRWVLSYLRKAVAASLSGALQWRAPATLGLEMVPLGPRMALNRLATRALGRPGHPELVRSFGGSADSG